MKHTPIQWIYTGHEIWSTSDGAHCVAITTHLHDAPFIANAVNMHQRLVESLKEALLLPTEECDHGEYIEWKDKALQILMEMGDNI